MIERGSQTRRAIAGLALGVAGVLGYFVVAFHLGAQLPGVRNYALPNWLIIVAALALSASAFARATPRRRLVPASLLVVNGLLAAAFAFILYVFTTVPPVPGPAIGAPAPDFALPDQQGTTKRLADFRGEPLLLVFYRGHW